MLSKSVFFKHSLTFVPFSTTSCRQLIQICIWLQQFLERTLSVHIFCKTVN